MADYSCTDGQSGIATCVGTVADGVSIDTSESGFFMFSVTATDNAGNMVMASVSYSVGFEPQ